MNYSLDMQCMFARARLHAQIENLVVEEKGRIAQNFAEARKRLLPDGETPSPTEQRQVREDSQGLGVPGRLSPSHGVAPSLADELTQAKRAGFMFGWKAAAVWANRDDLIADIGSPAYEKDCDAACGVMACPACGEGEDKVSTAAQRQEVPYGSDGKAVSVVLAVHSCAACGQSWTDHQAEVIRDFAVAEAMHADGVRVGADSLAAALLKGYGGSTMTSGPAGAKLTIFYDNPDDGEPAHDALVRALDAARTNGVKGPDDETKA